MLNESLIYDLEKFNRARAIVRVVLTEPLVIHSYYPNRHFALLPRGRRDPEIECVREMVGYVNKYQVSRPMDKDRDFICINPFGLCTLPLDQDRTRYGDFKISLRYILSLNEK